jgi:hypothetical protein
MPAGGFVTAGSLASDPWPPSTRTWRGDSSPAASDLSLASRGLFFFEAITTHKDQNHGRLESNCERQE